MDLNFKLGRYALTLKVTRLKPVYRIYEGPYFVSSFDTRKAAKAYANDPLSGRQGTEKLVIEKDYVWA